MSPCTSSAALPGTHQPALSFLVKPRLFRGWRTSVGTCQVPGSPRPTTPHPRHPALCPRPFSAALAFYPLTPSGLLRSPSAPGPAGPGSGAITQTRLSGGKDRLAGLRGITQNLLLPRPVTHPPANTDPSVPQVYLAKASAQTQSKCSVRFVNLRSYRRPASRTRPDPWSPRAPRSSPSRTASAHRASAEGFGCPVDTPARGQPPQLHHGGE